MNTLLTSGVAMLVASGSVLAPAQARPAGDVNSGPQWPVIAKIVMHDLQPPVLDSPHARLYAVSEPSALISVVSLDTNRVVDRIHTGTWLGEPAVDSPARMLYVPDTIANTVTVVNTRTNRVIAKIPIGEQPGLPVVDASRHSVYVVHGDSPKMTIIDTRSNTVAEVVDFASSLDDRVAETLSPPVLEPSTGLMYLSAYSLGRIVVVDAASNQVAATIEVGAGARLPLIDPASGRLYIPTADAIAVVDTVSRAVTARIPTSTFNDDLVLDQRHRQLYSTELLRARVNVIDVDTNAITASIAVGEMSQPVLDAPHSRLYVPIFFDGVIRVIDTRSNRLLRSIPLHDNPERAAIDVGRQRLYVTVFNGGKDALAVVDIGTTQPAQH